MNCYYHPETTIVATCQNCNKGLCKVCSDRFSVPICISCNRSKALTEKSAIMKEFFWMIGLPIIGVMLAMTDSQLGQAIRQNPIFGAGLFYDLIAVVVGWNMLNKLTAQYFLALPLIGWVIYFFVKFSISALIGFFVAPFKIYKNIKRLKEINQIETMN